MPARIQSSAFRRSNPRQNLPVDVQASPRSATPSDGRYGYMAASEQRKRNWTRPVWESVCRYIEPHAPARPEAAQCHSHAALHFDRPGTCPKKSAKVPLAGLQSWHMVCHTKCVRLHQPRGTTDSAPMNDTVKANTSGRGARAVHPGAGRRQAPLFPKGRVLREAEVAAVRALIGPEPYERPLLIEYLHKFRTPRDACRRAICMASPN